MRNHEERLEEVQKKDCTGSVQTKAASQLYDGSVFCGNLPCGHCGFSFCNAGVAQNIIVSDYDTFKTTASIFTEGTMFGYLLIGLIAFVLGVCVTILCLHIHNLQKEEKEMAMDLIATIYHH